VSAPHSCETGGWGARVQIVGAERSSFVLVVVAQRVAWFVSSSGSSNAALQSPLQVNSSCSCRSAAVLW
jgi:hypothetical protein